MHLKYAPFINHAVKLSAVEPPNMEGQVVIRGNVDGKPASLAALTLELSEALRIYRALKQMDIEGMAKAFGIP